MILRSPLPDLRIPDLDFSTFALQRARARPEATALIEGETGARVTYGEFVQRVDRAAGALRARGFGPGQSLAICAGNTPLYGIVAHAVWRAGGTLVTMNPLFTVREMYEELADARPRYVVAAADVLDKVGEAAQDIDAQLFALDEPHAGAESFMPLTQAGEGPDVPNLDPAAATALILYSSGTTGLPKGVRLSHRNLIAALLQHESGDLARETDVLLALSPFFHVVGLGGILNLGIYTGAAIVTMRRYSLSGMLELIARERISSVFLTPPVVLDLTKHPSVDEHDLSSLRSLLCAAAPLGAEIEQAAADRLGCVVRQGYGMTEATGPITTTLSERIKRGAVGQLVPSTELKVVDLVDGHELELGDEGEILVRGPQVMQGYLNQPAATAATLEPDGWLHTGDVGRFDADGFLYVVDRVKEIIKYKAYQVAPAELEAVLTSHPQVADAAVVPSPDEDSGEVPKAFVVRQPGATVSAEQLMSWLAEQVAPYKKVRRLEFVDTIPKSPSGKILRRVLVETERTRAER